MNTPITTKNNVRLRMSRRWPLITVAVLGLIIVWYAVLAVGVYGGYWQGNTTTAILRWSPLPVAMVGWQPLSYSEFLRQRQAVTRYTKYLQASSAGAYQAQDEANVSVTTLTKMIRLLKSEELLKKFNIAVTDADVRQAYTSQLVQNGDAEQVQSTIRELYGWTPEEFQLNVIRPAIIRDKLQEKLSFDETLSGAAKIQAENVMDIVRRGQETFEELAKKYSDDVYGSKGGDVGIVKQGEQVKEIDDATFGVTGTQISDLIHTKYGYHILKPTERTTVDGVDQVHLYQITILAPQVDDYLNAEFATTIVRVFAAGQGWDATHGRSTAK